MAIARPDAAGEGDMAPAPACGEATDCPDLLHATASCSPQGSCEYACEEGFAPQPPELSVEAAGCGCEVATEVCDGADNDCDGEVDEELAPIGCELQQGVCAGASLVCVEGQRELYRSAMCDAGLYGAHSGEYLAQGDEGWRCDGADNDCDGQADEACCGAGEDPVPRPLISAPVGGVWGTAATRAVPGGQGAMLAGHFEEGQLQLELYDQGGSLIDSSAIGLAGVTKPFSLRLATARSSYFVALVDTGAAIRLLEIDPQLGLEDQITLALPNADDVALDVDDNTLLLAFSQLDYSDSADVLFCRKPLANWKDCQTSGDWQQVHHFAGSYGAGHLWVSAVLGQAGQYAVAWADEADADHISGKLFSSTNQSVRFRIPQPVTPSGGWVAWNPTIAWADADTLAVLHPVYAGRGDALLRLSLVALADGSIDATDLTPQGTYFGDLLLALAVHDDGTATLAYLEESLDPINLFLATLDLANPGPVAPRRVFSRPRQLQIGGQPQLVALPQGQVVVWPLANDTSNKQLYSIPLTAGGVAICRPNG